MKKKSTNLPLAVILYIGLAFYVSPFNVVRQGVAIALNFYSSRYLDRRRPLFIIVNLIAASFHSSVIFVAALQWLVRKRRPSFMIVISILSVTVVGYVLLSASGAFRGIAGLLNPRYETYVADAQAAGFGTLLVILATVALIILSLRLPSSPDLHRYQVYMMLAVPFLVAGLHSSPIARLHDYFSIFVILVLPNQVKVARSSPLLFTILSLSAVVYFAFFLRFYGGLVPYQVQ